MPVEASVAAILRATWPDLPSPVTMTRPLASRISSTAAVKAVAERALQGGRDRGDAGGFRIERAQAGLDGGARVIGAG